MPHIIVEYSSDVADHVDMPKLLKLLHNSLADQGIDKTRIKTRGIQLPYVVIGDSDTNGHMVHATLLLLAGRDIPTKKQYGDALHTIAKETVQSSLQNCAVTLEIRDMDRDSYYL